MTDKLVTHRVTEVSPNDDGTWTISMKGDANDEPDLETYTVGDSVLTPALQIPEVGTVVSKLVEPAVALPVLLSLVALLGLSLLDEPARSKADRRRRAQVAEPDGRTGEDATGDDVTSDDVTSDVITCELPVTQMDVEPAGFESIEDLDAALAAFGIDVSRLPALGSSGDLDPEWRSDERDLVMSG
jgi:hypothetical protein